MIFDKISEYKKYVKGEAWDKAFDFIMSLNAGSAEGRHDIDGDDIFAIVMSYETKADEQALPETHELYHDIQVSIAGSESIKHYHRDDLEVEIPYDKEKDITFYKNAPANSILLNTPGYFSYFDVQDAHKPGLKDYVESAHVKKAVIKIKANLL